ncbi:hypothetical protein VRB21_03260 [Pseudomonas poae]
MDKIYKLLPWLNSPQAVDWLCRLTDTQMTEELLICLCGAGHARIYIDVGGACLGVDDEDWSCEVVASGKQMVVDPSALAKPDADRSHILLRGEVLNLSDGKKIIERMSIGFQIGSTQFSFASSRPIFLHLRTR